MEIIYNRLKKNLKHLKKWSKKNNINAYRVYNKDIPDWPYTVDLYHREHQLYIIVSYFPSIIDEDPKKQHHLDDIFKALQELFNVGVEFIYLKTRRPQLRFDQFTKQDQVNIEVTIQEGGAQFIVNLSDYIDVGLFLDHRKMRQEIILNPPSRNLLNLFCYTGTVSVMAALKHTRTHNVDLSNTYLDWARRNFEINQIPLILHEFEKYDVLDFLKKRVDLYKSFDCIYVDPPTFSNSKSAEQDFDVQLDHESLLQLCQHYLSPNGRILFSCHKKKFKLAASLNEIFNIENIEYLSVDEDFKNKRPHHAYALTLK